MKVVILCLVVFTLCYSVPVPRVKYEFIMPPRGGFPYSHVCSIVERPDGNVVATFQAGEGEGKPDSKIWASIRNSTTGEWSPTFIAASKPETCCMNACMYQNDSGAIFLTFHCGGDILTEKGHCSTHSWKAYYTSSLDGGETWNTHHTELPEGCLGCVKNKCVKLSNGEVICPSSQEAFLRIGYWAAHFETTTEDFSSFKRRNNILFNYSPVTEKVCLGIIQPTVFETSPGHLFALFRSGCDVLAEAHSEDYGHSWPETAESSHIPNPNAGIDGTQMPSRKDLGFLLAFNNNTDHRTPLTLAQSLDDGKRWEYIMDIETDPNGSFAYPALIPSARDPNVAHLCYTYSADGQHNMRYARLEFP